MGMLGSKVAKQEEEENTSMNKESVEGEFIIVLPLAT